MNIEYELLFYFHFARTSGKLPREFSIIYIISRECWKMFEIVYRMLILSR